MCGRTRIWASAFLLRQNRPVERDKMRRLMLAMIVALQTGLAIGPALAQEGCPNSCPEGQVRSIETGKCEPYKPLMV